MRFLGLSSDDVLDVLAEVAASLPEISLLFEMSLEDPDKLGAVVEEARKTLRGRVSNAATT